MTKFVRYRLKLIGQPALITLLQPYITHHQSRNPTLSEARKLRDAIRTVFGGDADLEIASVSRGAGPRVTRL